MYPDISVNQLMKEGKKTEAAKLVLDALRQVINNGMPGMDMTRDEWLYVLPEVITQAQAATPVDDPSTPEDERHPAEDAEEDEEEDEAVVDEGLGGGA